MSSNIRRSNPLVLDAPVPLSNLPSTVVDLFDTASYSLEELDRRVDVSPTELQFKEPSGAAQFASVYLTILDKTFEELSNVVVKLSGCRIAAEKHMEINEKWGKITLPIQFEYETREKIEAQWGAVDNFMQFISRKINNMWKAVTVKPLYKNYNTKSFNTIYMNWPTYNPDAADGDQLTGRDLEVVVDGKSIFMNAIRFKQEVLPATFDVYAELKPYARRIDNEIVVGFNLKPVAFVCNRDMESVTQYQYPPGKFLPNKLVARKPIV